MTTKKNKFSRFTGVITTKVQEEAAQAVEDQRRIIELDMAIHKLDTKICAQSSSLGEDGKLVAEWMSERAGLIEHRARLSKF